MENTSDSVDKTKLSPLALIVDADDQRRMLVGQVLQRLGYERKEIEFSACLDGCQRLQPRLLVLSSSLAGHDSFALCEQVHTGQGQPPSIFMVLETVNQEMITSALQAGAEDYITSPIDMNLLERRLRQLASSANSLKTKEIREALREFELRYKTLFDNAPISIFSKNRDGYYTSANAYNLGYHRPGGPISYTDTELFPEETARALRAADIQVMETGCELEIEETIPTVQGVRVVLSRKVPLRNADGEIDGVLGISEDITERKKVEKALHESNQRFQALFEHSPHAIFLVEADENAAIVDCNPVACRMNGYSREELIGQSIRILDVEGVSVVPENGLAYADWLRTRGQVQYEIMHRRKDGSVFPIEVSTCLVNVGGRELVLGIDRDISERARIENSERKLRVLAEALRDTAFALNSTLNLDEVLDRILMHAEPVVPHETSSIGLIEGDCVRIVRCRGFAERGLEALALSMCFPLEGHSHYTAMISNRQPIVVEDVRDYAGWFTSAEVDWIRAHVATPIIVRDEVIGFLHLDSSTPGAFTAEHARNLQVFASQVAIAIQNAQYADDLERRVRERTAELRCALIRERELSELKTRFVTMASHEFRTPMSIMMTSSELLKKYYDRMTPEQRQERLTHIQAEIKNMTSLLEDILKVNRTVDSHQQQVTLKPLDVSDFCRNLLLKISTTERRPIDFVSYGEIGVALLDANLLTDILTSLLSNAVKYSKMGQPIRLELACEDEQLVFKVEDNGMGIPEEDQARVFEVFHRGRNVNHISGTGLGLTIAKQSTELHGGNLTFVSSVGIGTTFRLSIRRQLSKEWA